jgi:hypothetical protein
MNVAREDCETCVALLDVLAFYGNPKTYIERHPFLTMPLDDFDDRYYEFTDRDLGMKPGRRAREALMKHSREATGRERRSARLGEEAK